MISFEKLKSKTLINTLIKNEQLSHEEGISLSIEDEMKDEELPVFNSNIGKLIKIVKELK